MMSAFCVFVMSVFWIAANNVSETLPQTFPRYIFISARGPDSLVFHLFTLIFVKQNAKDYEIPLIKYEFLTAKWRKLFKLVMQYTKSEL